MVSDDQMAEFLAPLTPFGRESIRWSAGDLGVYAYSTDWRMDETAPGERRLRGTASGPTTRGAQATDICFGSAPSG